MNEPQISIEPPRPTADEVIAELTRDIQLLAGPDAVPRPEQIEAVTAVVANRQRTLLVARTGFGKSAVYFSSTRMLRARGWGPTVVVSPLLALMRDQVAAAEKLGLNAVTINSSNIDSWVQIEAQIADDTVDASWVPGHKRRFDTLGAGDLSKFLAELSRGAICSRACGRDKREKHGQNAPSERRRVSQARASAARWRRSATAWPSPSGSRYSALPAMR